MRIRTGLRPEDWLDHGPSTPLAPKGFSGGLVVSESSKPKPPSATPEQRRLAYARTKRYREKLRDAA